MVDECSQNYGVNEKISYEKWPQQTTRIDNITQNKKLYLKKKPRE